MRFCPECRTKLITLDGMLTCSECGEVVTYTLEDPFICEESRITFKGIAYYERMSNLRMTFMKLNADVVPKHKIRKLFLSKIKNFDTIHDLANIFMKQKLRRYNKYIYWVFKHRKGFHAVYIDSNKQSKIEGYFKIIETNFINTNENRHNMIGYLFLVRKVCEMIGWTDIAENIVNLNSRKTISKWNKIWNEKIFLPV